VQGIIPVAQKSKLRSDKKELYWTGSQEKSIHFQMRYLFYRTFLLKHCRHI